MAFTEVTDLGCDVTISLGGVNKKTNKANPTKLEGFYLGAKQIEDQKKKSGKSFIYVFQTSNGNVGVWGKTDLDRKMSAVEPGTLARLSYTGMQKIPGKNDMYKYKVEVDQTQTIEVSAQQTPVSDDSANTGYSEPEEAYEELNEEEEAPADEVAPARPVAPARAASAPSADQRAKVQALLNKGRAATSK